MCRGAILWSNLSKVYYGCTAQDTDRIGFRDQTVLNKEDDGFWSPTAANCIENWGNNAIRLNVPATTKTVYVEFVGEAGKDGYVDLAKTFGETDASSIGFAVAEYDAPEARDALLKLGMDYFSRTWLNGAEVLDNRKGFGTRCAPGSATVKVRLEKGRNVIAHKIKSGSAGYGFYCELSEPGYDTDAGDGGEKPKSRTDLLYGTGLKQSPPYSYRYW